MEQEGIVIARKKDGNITTAIILTRYPLLLTKCYDTNYKLKLDPKLGCAI